MNRRRNQFSIRLPAGRDGYIGRECPKCSSYFKIVTGTGLPGSPPCYCPYCGWQADHSHFHTRSQIEYARSVGEDKVTRALHSKLKRMADNVNRRSAQNNGFLRITMDVKTGRTRIRHPIESKLETEIECANCTLKYAVYGVYAFCPDCGRHNAVQMLEMNLEISDKLLGLAESSDDALEIALISKALTAVVASFDGFGRAACETFACKSSYPSQAEKIRFQNLIGARTNIQKLFGVDIAAGLTQVEWKSAIRCFQKRHVLEHRSVVVDKEYIAKANDPKAIVGRKVRLSEGEVRHLIVVVRKLASHIHAELENLP